MARSTYRHVLLVCLALSAVACNDSAAPPNEETVSAVFITTEPEERLASDQVSLYVATPDYVVETSPWFPRETADPMDAFFLNNAYTAVGVLPLVMCARNGRVTVGEIKYSASEEVMGNDPGLPLTFTEVQLVEHGQANDVLQGPIEVSLNESASGNFRVDFSMTGSFTVAKGACRNLVLQVFPPTDERVVGRYFVFEVEPSLRRITATTETEDGPVEVPVEFVGYGMSLLDVAESPYPL